MTLDITQFYQTFFDEAEELLAEMELLLLNLDIVNPDAEHLNAIFRAAHSIKGGGATFGFTALTDTTHILESLLDRARTGALRLRTDMIDLFLETKDVLRGQLDAYRASQEPDAVTARAICAKLQALATENSPAPQALDKPAPGAAERAEAGAPAPEHAANLAAASPAGPNDPPAHVVAQLQELAGADEPHARQAQASAALEAAAAIAAASGPAAAEKSCLKIVLTGVNEKDCTLLLEEICNLGTVAARTSAGDATSVWLDSDCAPDDIIAVCCFVIDADQIEVTRVARKPDAPAPIEAEQGQKREAVPKVSSVSEEPEASSAPEVLEASAAPKAPEAPEAPEAASGRAAAPSNAAPAPASRGGAATTEGGSIRVGVEKVDQLINLVGELVITQAMLTQTTSSFDPVLHDRLFNGMTQLERNARDLQEAVMSIRMMPMDYVFSRFPRLVRDLAAKLGKQVELLTVGQATELDKSLIERIIDPLTHLVRNSIDHGIELPAARTAAGKDPVGQLMLSAQHQGGNIVIEVSDDGAGLRRDKILAKARKQGIAVSDTMSDDEVWQLIFMPGFSTAEQVTDVSGRGVGMDVVQRNIQEMGGHVEIRSSAGQGTCTRIVLPLTLAILDGMSVKVGGETFILPLNFVMESLQPAAGDIYAVAGDERVIRVRGEYLPLVELHSAFGVTGARTDPTQAIVTIIQAEGRRFALMVDELVGQHQVVVKNLETNYRKVHGISAATILGDGSVALIVDVAALNRAHRLSA